MSTVCIILEKHFDKKCWQMYDYKEFFLQCLSDTNSSRLYLLQQASSSGFRMQLYLYLNNQVKFQLNTYTCHLNLPIFFPCFQVLLGLRPTNFLSKHQKVLILWQPGTKRNYFSPFFMINLKYLILNRMKCDDTGLVIRVLYLERNFHIFHLKV